MAEMSPKEFLDAHNPLGDRATRREAIVDYVGNMDDEMGLLKDAVALDDLEGARRHFEELKAWLDALDDNLCERDENGSRVD